MFRISNGRQLICSYQSRVFANYGTKHYGDSEHNSSHVNVADEKLTDFFAKAVKNVKEQSDAESIAVMAESSTSPKTKPKQNKTDKPVQWMRRVPYTMGHLLKEMDLVQEAKIRPHTNETFASMFRKSPFVQLGNFTGKVVIGVVIENMDDSDLYIDFGGKFPCVCKRPQSKGGGIHYDRGSMVRVRLRDVEIASKFMLNTQGVSVREADAHLLGPYHGHLLRPDEPEPKEDNTTGQIVTDDHCVSVRHWRLT